jgi:hypothetical protein
MGRKDKHIYFHIGAIRIKLYVYNYTLSPTLQETVI